MFLCGKRKTIIMAAVNIQIDVPNLGTYEMEELKHKLTAYARNLIAASNTSEKQTIFRQQPVNEDKKCAARRNRLRRLCGREISPEDIQEDERLAYLISK